MWADELVVDEFLIVEGLVSAPFVAGFFDIDSVDVFYILRFETSRSRLF